MAAVQRGATWVKVTADFRHVPEFTDTDSTYSLAVIQDWQAHCTRPALGLAAHSTLPDVRALVATGVDSIEHGLRMDTETVGS